MVEFIDFEKHCLEHMGVDNMPLNDIVIEISGFNNPPTEDEFLTSLSWVNYHKHIVAAKCFVALDRFIWFYLWKWANRRYSKKGYRWIADKYFKKVGNRKWTFFGTFDNGTEILLKYASDTIIKRHVLINGKANPYCANWDRYFRRRYALRKAS